MANQEVKIFFKVEGLDGYITDLNELQSALKKTDTETKDLSNSQKEVNKEVKETENTIVGLNTKLSDLNKKLNETEIGSEAFDELKEQIKDVEKELDVAKNGQKGFTDELANAPGAVGGLTKSVQGLGVAFKALLANPVILVITGIVAAVTALFKAFTSTKEGGEALDRVMAGVSAVFDVFRDVLVKVTEVLIDVFTNPKESLISFGTAIKENIVNRFEGILEFIPNIAKSIKLLFERDFSGAAETAANAFLKVTTGTEDAVNKIGDAFNAVKDVVDEATTEATEAARLTGVLQDLKDKERDLNEERAKQNALLAETKLRVDDTTLSLDERKAALEEAGAAEEDILNKQLELEGERLAALEALAAQSDSDEATLNELSAQRIKLANLQEQSTQKQIALARQKARLDAEEKAVNDEKLRQAEEQAKREFEISEELRRAKLDAEKLELDDLKLKYEEQLKLAGDNEELQKQLTEKYEQDRLNTEKKYADERKKQEDETQKTINDIINGYAEKQYNSEQERILAELEQQYLADVEKLKQAGATAEQLAALDANYQDKVTAQTKKGEADRAELRKQSAKSAAKLVSDLFAGFAALNNARTADDEKEARKQFKINKAFSISQALINTALAVSDALAKDATFPGSRFISAAAAGAAGLAQVLSIRNQEFEGGGSVDSNIQAPSFNPQTALNNRNQQLTDLQDPGEEINLSRQQEPIRAYVVSTEVESSLAANQQIENLSRL